MTRKTVWFKTGIFGKKAVFIITPCCLLYVFYVLVDIHRSEPGISTVVSYKPQNQNQKYLINTSTCRIPDIDPYNEEVKKFVSREKYVPCTSLELLTYIDKSDGVATLKVNNTLLPQYSFWKVKCCYSKIFRINFFKKSDNEISYSPCVEFNEKVDLTFPYIKVECWNFYHTVYTNVHATVIPGEDENNFEDRNNTYSVLLVGIDSISKLNLRRTMPKTYKYLEENFHNLKGYNKIGDNTFPNLMAILTGQNNNQLRKSCTYKMKLNDCDMIWSTFRELGYATAYAEDECSIATFNFDRPGFSEPPTDYYYRPYFVASEELDTTKRSGMTYCAGPQTSGERVLNVAKDFAVSFKDVPSFGLFWMNSFSHDDINMPSAMDERVLDFLSDTSFKWSLRNTIMIFFSDHGFRFGNIRYTHTGWLEERLPFIYIHIPEEFKRRFKDRYDNFIVNTGRLTTPYDVHDTLQEILEIGNPEYVARSSTGCLNSNSLFERVAYNRSCFDAAIDLHWCTCTGHIYVDPSSASVHEVAKFVVDSINGIVKTYEECHACATYKLKKVVAAGMSQYYPDKNKEMVRYFLVLINTEPKAIFEATVEATEKGSFRLLGDVSRLNKYKDYSSCVKNGMLKKYCYCDSNYVHTLNFIQSAICIFSDC